jgi:prevent-host-death family protein
MGLELGDQRIMNDVARVPASKFRREMRKWLRYVEEHEMIVITQRNGPDLVCLKYDQYERFPVCAAQ